MYLAVMHFHFIYAYFFIQIRLTGTVTYITIVPHGIAHESRVAKLCPSSSVGRVDFYQLMTY